MPCMSCCLRRYGERDTLTSHYVRWCTWGWDWRRSTWGWGVDVIYCTITSTQKRFSRVFNTVSIPIGVRYVSLVSFARPNIP